MSKYIDADAFIADIKKKYCEDCKYLKGMKNGTYKFIYEIRGVRCLACDIGDMIDAVDGFPTADVDPVVHGRWSKQMRFTEDFMGNRTYGYKCSVCGKLANRLQFCGNCGAKMDESEVEK